MQDLFSHMSLNPIDLFFHEGDLFILLSDFSFAF